MSEVRIFNRDGTEWPHVHCMRVAEDYWRSGFIWGLIVGMSASLAVWVYATV